MAHEHFHMASTYQPPFYRAFESGFSVRSWMGDLTFSVCRIGTVSAMDGRLVVCDPLVEPITSPLAVTLPAGQHDVTIAIARDAGADERVAAAMLRVGAGDPIEWELALRSDQPLSQLDPDDVGIPVDSATIAFASVEPAELHAARMEGEPRYFDQVVAKLHESYQHTREWADLGDFVICSTGCGDGMYPVFVGRDDQGRPVCVTVDFGLLDPPDDEPASAI